MPTLFDTPPSNGTPTSIAAAQSIVPHLSGLRLDVCQFIRDRGEQGCTRDEIAKGLGLAIQTVCPRVAELIARRLIRETTTQRKTSTGRAAAVLAYCGNQGE